MGGQAEAITTEMRRTFTAGPVAAATALAVAVAALGSAGGPDGGAARAAGRAARGRRPRPQPAGKRKFRRIAGAALTELLPAATGNGAEPVPAPADTPPHDADPEQVPPGKAFAAGPAVPGGRPSKPATSVQLPDDTSLVAEPGQPPQEPGIDPSPGPAEH